MISTPPAQTSMVDDEPRARALGALVGVGLGFAAVAAHAVLSPLIGPFAPYAPIFPFALAAALIAGMWPGLLSAVIGVVGIATLWVDQSIPGPVPAWRVFAGVALALLCASVAVVLGARRRSLERSLRATAELCSTLLARKKVLRAEAGATRAQLEALLAAAPVFILIAHDTRCDAVTANDAMCRWMGIRADTELSASDERVRLLRLARHGAPLLPDDHPLARAARGEAVEEGEWELAAPDGAARHVRGRAVAIRNADGALAGAVVAFVDVGGAR